jgi:hypothetical protein
MFIISLIFILNHPNNFAQESNDKIIFKDIKNKYQVVIPSDWKVLELNDQANIEVGNAKDEIYFILISESKDDLSRWNIEKHSRITLASILASLSLPTIEGPNYLNIDGDKAVQYILSGEIQGLNIVYIHTTVESEKYFNQLLAWTLKSRFSDKEQILKDVINSFQVIEAK